MRGGVYAENLDLSDKTLTLVGGFAGDFASRSPVDTPSTLKPANPSVSTVKVDGFANVVWDGVALTGASCTAMRANTWTTGSKFRIVNTRVHDNVIGGGCSRTVAGIDLIGNTRLNIEVANSVIENNVGINFGGGASLGVYEGGNPASSNAQNDGFGTLTGIGQSGVWVHHSIVRGNKAIGQGSPHGGGMAIWSNAVIEKNEFSGNESGSLPNEGVGGALILIYSGDINRFATARIDSNWFQGNKAGNHGSAVMLDGTLHALLTNNVVLKNKGQGALLLDSDCNTSSCGDDKRVFMSIVNNTVALNEGAGLQIQNGTAHLYYNVFWKNSGASSGDVVNNPVSSSPVNKVRGSQNVINISAAGVWPELLQSINAESVEGLVDASTSRLSVSAAGGKPLLASTAAFTPAFNIGTWNIPVPAGTASDVYGLSAMPSKDFNNQVRAQLLYGAFATVKQ